MNRRREKAERDERIAKAEMIAMRAQVQAREALAVNAKLILETAALRAALIKKRIVSQEEIDAEKPPLPITPLAVKP